MIAIKKRMIDAGIRRQAIEAVLTGALKDAMADFQELDEITIKIALGDLISNDRGTKAS